MIKELEDFKFNSLIDNIIRIVCVADSIGAAEEHLEWDVGNEFPHLLESLPRTLVQEAHGNIKSGTAPVLSGEQPVEVVCHVGAAFEQVVSAHSGGQQRLVGVSEGRVHQQQALVVTNRFGETSWALGQQNVTETARRLESCKRDLHDKF